MKTILFMLMAIVLVASACTPFVTPESCQDSPSAILKITKGNPTGLDRSLLMINIAGLEKGSYEANTAVKFIEKVQYIVNGGVSYLELLNFITESTKEVNKAIGFSVVLLGPDIAEIAKSGGKDLISECDRLLINNHLDKQLLILDLYR